MVQCIAFSRDGKTVATGTGGNVNREFETVKVWDVRSGKLVRTLETTDKMAVKVAFAPDGKTLGAVLQEGDALAEVVLWDAAEGKRLQSLPDSDGIPAIAFSSDGKALLGAARNKLRVWDVETGKTIQASDIKTDLDFSDKSWSAFAFSPDGKTVAIAGKQAGKYVVTLWDVKTAKQTKTLVGPEGFIWTLAFSRDGRTLASGEDGKICLWDFDEKGNPKN